MWNNSKGTPVPRWCFPWRETRKNFAILCEHVWWYRVENCNRKHSFARLGSYRLSTTCSKMDVGWYIALIVEVSYQPSSLDEGTLLRSCRLNEDRKLGFRSFAEIQNKLNILAVLVIPRSWKDRKLKFWRRRSSYNLKKHTQTLSRASRWCKLDQRMSFPCRTISWT